METDTFYISKPGFIVKYKCEGLVQQHTQCKPLQSSTLFLIYEEAPVTTRCPICVFTHGYCKHLLILTVQTNLKAG